MSATLGRLRAKFMREIRQQEEMERDAANRGAATLDPDVAATRIQKVSSYSQLFSHVDILIDNLFKQIHSRKYNRKYKV